MDKNYYDVILVGGGIANIMCAIQLANTDKSVCLIELGSEINKRICPKAKTGKCVNCSPCKITSGFGGAGFFSDCKLTYSYEVGGDLADYIGIDTFNTLMNEVSDQFTKFGARTDFVYNETFANQFQYECSKYGMKLLKYPVRHLGTDGAYEVMCNIYDFLNKAPNITILTNTRVESINFKEKSVIISLIVNNISKYSQVTYKSKYISIAVGRLGSEWLSDMCKTQGLKVVAGPIDIGVRVECPRSITDNVTDNLYDMKIVYNSRTGNMCRTFCVNPGGIVTRENYSDWRGNIACVNGHSFSDNASDTTNFALLVSCHFTEPFNSPIDYGKSICRLSNMLSDNKPTVQRLIDLKAYKRSTKDRIKKLIYKPTLTEAEPGDLRYIFPSNVIDSILDFLEKLDKVIPGINDGQTILYSPECKFSSAKIELNNKLQSEGFPGVYFAGDSAGISRGIMQAAIAGTYIAKDILK
jgi:hypothetical protein